ncbi:potassium channel family protein [Sinomicrobium weinanense]|uniref:Two pore domain potassium channel family protein n=1 Tax=Sinomicrobium weinanense TaxID=2842200 RepID=A0A926JU86_9FLAO|nr:potassium channel family protein [Sinomicrobium weinanense]MBC9797337.1 two pore domain potassium channel family protein [Sinomicrobium weinanense]MBU3124517.1 potassium channel family protein [Sinomicrobium weinanense]
MKNNYLGILRRRKYEFLLAALLLHLYIGVFFSNIEFYAHVVWPINMLLLGIFSLGVFSCKNRIRLLLRNILFVLVVAVPVASSFMKPDALFMQVVSVVHIAFYTMIFIEILRYLVKPGHVNLDIVSASACGYLLLIEIGIFTMQLIYYSIPDSFTGIDPRNFITIYLDLVYFCNITLTTIGYGDITPANHFSKLATAMLGLAGQFYTVVLIGIMISKYTSLQNSK